MYTTRSAPSVCVIVLVWQLCNTRWPGSVTVQITKVLKDIPLQVLADAATDRLTD